MTTQVPNPRHYPEDVARFVLVPEGVSLTDKINEKIGNVLVLGS